MSQDLHIGLGAGFAGYLGDLQGKQFLINTNNPGIGAYVKYQCSPIIGIRAGINSGKISAYDRNNIADLRPRNLSFETWIHEANVLIEYSLLNLSGRNITPHLIGGIAVFHFNPYAFDYNGNKVFLKPLSTEGQGLPEYPAVRPYALVQWAIPMGGGVRVKLNPYMEMLLEIGYRRLFTDYLDDVSGNYADPKILLDRKGPLAMKMAFRTDELPNAAASYPDIHLPRGKARYKDWYSFYTASISFNVSKMMHQKKENKHYRCPRQYGVKSLAVLH